MIPKLHVVLRTCDRSSLQSNRIFAKDEIVIRCLRSLITALKNQDHTLHIIDDDSSNKTKELMQEIATNASFNFLPEIKSKMSIAQKSRYSVKVAYDYIYTLPEDDLVYIVEDDYLHYPDAMEKMLKSWELFSSWDDTVEIGIFPQDFKQLYFYPENGCSHAYLRHCIILPGIDRYYRTTWYTHESFIIRNRVIKKYRTHFDELLDIGFVAGKWEGNSISKVWQQDEIKMLMPLKTHAIHLSDPNDLSFFVNDLDELWEMYK
jgi:glycosyltransferase involved in cell wall biosynthesis